MADFRQAVMDQLQGVYVAVAMELSSALDAICLTPALSSAHNITVRSSGTTHPGKGRSPLIPARSPCQDVEERLRLEKRPSDLCRGHPHLTLWNSGYWVSHAAILEVLPEIDRNRYWELFDRTVEERRR